MVETKLQEIENEICYDRRIVWSLVAHIKDMDLLAQYSTFNSFAKCTKSQSQIIVFESKMRKDKRLIPYYAEFKNHIFSRFDRCVFLQKEQEKKNHFCNNDVSNKIYRKAYVYWKD